MDSKISDFINLDYKLNQLNIKLTGDFCILPENIEIANSPDEFIFTETATPIKKYLRQNGVNIQVIDNENSSYRQRKSVDFYAPLLFIGYTVFSENSAIVSVGLNVLSNYVTDFFKGTFGDKKVKMEIVVETSPKKTYKSIIYEGSVDGMKELSNVIKSLRNEQ
jgi:hypothetical protein